MYKHLLGCNCHTAARTLQLSSAINVQMLSSDERRTVGSQVRDGLRHFIRCSNSPQRIRRVTPFDQTGVLDLRHTGTPLQLGADHRRIYAIHPNASGGQIERAAAGELVDGRLRDAVGEFAGESARPVDAGNVDDASARRRQVRNTERRQLERCADVDRHHAVQLLQRRGLDGAVFQDPGVVDEHVQAPELADGGVDQSGDVGLGAEVGNDGDGLECTGANALTYTVARKLHRVVYRVYKLMSVSSNRNSTVQKSVARPEVLQWREGVEAGVWSGAPCGVQGTVRQA